MSQTQPSPPPRKRWTVPMLAEARAAGRKLVMLTSYDAGFSRVLDDNGVDLILIGDGASEIGTKGVESGVWYASSILRPFNEGKVEAEIAIAAARGEEPAEDLINSAVDPEFPTGYIDQSNVDKWDPEWAG